MNIVEGSVFLVPLVHDAFGGVYLGKCKRTLLLSDLVVFEQLDPVI
jgi:hypothetical protein